MNDRSIDTKKEIEQKGKKHEKESEKNQKACWDIMYGIALDWALCLYKTAGNRRKAGNNHGLRLDP